MKRVRDTGAYYKKSSPGALLLGLKRAPPRRPGRARGSLRRRPALRGDGSRGRWGNRLPGRPRDSRRRTVTLRFIARGAVGPVARARVCRIDTKNRSLGTLFNEAAAMVCFQSIVSSPPFYPTGRRVGPVAEGARTLRGLSELWGGGGGRGSRGRGCSPSRPAVAWALTGSSRWIRREPLRPWVPRQRCVSPLR